MVKRCIKSKFTIEQVRRFSLTWEFPLRSHQQVTAVVKRLGLIEEVRRRDSAHHDAMIERMIAIVTDAWENGWTLTYWSKEQTIGPGVRCDICIVVEKNGQERTFYLESQLSDLSESRWAQKLYKYVQHYESTRKPFRVLVDLERPRQVAIAQTVAEGLLIDRPELNLFLFRSGERWVTRWDTPYSLVS